MSEKKNETKIFNTRLAKRDVEALEGLIEKYGLESKADALRICIRVVNNLRNTRTEIQNFIVSGMILGEFIDEQITPMLDEKNRLINRYEDDRTLKG